MAVNRSKLFQFFKYAVYALLTTNIYLFFVDEFAAAPLRFPEGIGFGNVIEAYTATIDTAAWVVLLLMFELETYVLEDRHFTRAVTWSLHSLRAICYSFIVYAFYGYIQVLVYVTDAAPLAGIMDVCALLPGDWSWSTTLNEYATITAANCADWSAAASFFQFPHGSTIVDQAGLTDIAWLAWVDVINAGVWLAVVLVLELDVRLQERNILEGTILQVTNGAKFILYSILLLAAVYWGFEGGLVDFWDAFLWLVAFVFIELNVFDWRKEEQAELAAAGEA